MWRVPGFTVFAFSAVGIFRLERVTEFDIRSTPYRRGNGDGVVVADSGA